MIGVMTKNQREDKKTRDRQKNRENEDASDVALELRS